MDDRFVCWRLIGVRVEPWREAGSEWVSLRDRMLYVFFFRSAAVPVFLNVSALLRITSYLEDLSIRAFSTHLLFFCQTVY